MSAMFHWRWFDEKNDKTYIALVFLNREPDSRSMLC